MPTSQALFCSPYSAKKKLPWTESWTVAYWPALAPVLLKYPAFVCECAHVHICTNSGIYPQKHLRNHTTVSGKTAAKERERERETQEVIPAALTKRRREGKTKSTGNTERNVPWNWKLNMLTICQVSVCNWDAKVSTSKTASCLLLHSRHLSLNSNIFNGDASLLLSDHFSKCENDSWIAACHVVPFKNTKAEESKRKSTANYFLCFQEHYSF